MNILLIFPGFIVAFIILFCYEYKIKLLKIESINKVHFYVARDTAARDYVCIKLVKDVEVLNFEQMLLRRQNTEYEQCIFQLEDLMTYSNDKPTNKEDNE